MEVVKSFIENYVELPVGDWEKVRKGFTTKVYPAETLLLGEGQVCRYLYFLETGLVRFFLFKEGNDITKFFTESPYLFTSQVSFTSELPAKENIQTLEDSVIWEMRLEIANELLKLESWNTFVRTLIQEVQFFTEQILIEVQTETAEVRYRKMLSANPGLVTRVPLKHLASFFGIAPQSLSRIRNKLMNDRTF